jgi:DNA-directed RNA polymerase subunit omega
MVAAHRSREIAAGTALTVERDNDKNPVVALREIADETIDIEALRDEMIKSHQRHVAVEEPEEELVDLSVAEEELASLTSAVSPEERVREEDLSVEAEPGEEDAEEEAEEEGEEKGEEADAPPAAEDPEEAPEPEET